MLRSAPRRGPEKGAGRRGFGRLRQERSGRWSAAYTGPDTALHRFARGSQWIVGILVVALIVANCLNVAADLAAIGSGMQLLHLGPDHLWAAIAGAALTAALIWGSFQKLAKAFKWLCLVLLGYLGVLVVAHVPWGEMGLGTLGLRMTWT